MAKYVVETVEERPDGKVALAALAKQQRVAGYLALFSADPRISGIIDSEAAVVQMEADVDFPTQGIEI